MTNSARRFAFAAVLMAAAATFLQAHAINEVFPARLELQKFPEQLGGLTSIDVPIDQDTRDKLGRGDFLNRAYLGPEKSNPIYLFIAYYPSQRAGDSPHSPQNCRPGSGWTPIENQRITLTMSGHAPFRVNRYLIAKGDSRQLVLYWFWAHDRGVASEWWAKYYLVHDSMRMNRSDGSIVSITTPLDRGESADAAQQRILPFVDHVFPLLNTFIPE